MDDRLMTETKTRTANRSDRITKRTVTAAATEAERYLIWDSELKGFALRVEPSGVKSYLVRYRVTGAAGRGQRQLTLGRHGPLTPDEARRRAMQALAAASGGVDPLDNRHANRDAISLKQLADRFLGEHVDKKRKPKTAAHYRWTLKNYVLPTLGSRKAIDLRDSDIAKLHQGMAETPYLANRVRAVVGSMYAWGVRRGLLPDGLNPAYKVEKYREHHRERFLTREELDRLGAALRAGETVGFLRPPRDDKRAPKSEIRDIVSVYASAAIRLLLFTGARVGEILSLEWTFVDCEREALLLPDSKTGAKVIHLNAQALDVLSRLPRIEGNPFVIVGTKKDAHLHDLKGPWVAICAAAGLTGVRLHDLRHTFASYGAASNLGLPVIGRLLGHSQAATTARYAHLADDPVKRASRSIADAISSAMGEPLRPKAPVIELRG